MHVDFPEQIVGEMLSRFGVGEASDLEPWPFPDLSEEIVVGFRTGERRFLLKKRPVEQRGVRSIYETQYIQKQLRANGLPVAALWESPGGETLLEGPNWVAEETAYYEIQERVTGSHAVLNSDTAREVGRFLGHFHQVGSQIDTFLVNKGYWIRDFTKRRYIGVKRLSDRIQQTNRLSGGDRCSVEEAIDRAYSFERITARSWGLYHGDMCGNNLLWTDDGFFLVDLDELGIGEVWGDLFSLVSETTGISTQTTCDLLRGYREGGGQLNEEDLLAITDALLLGRVSEALIGSDADVDVEGMHEELEAIRSA